RRTRTGGAAVDGDRRRRGQGEAVDQLETGLHGHGRLVALVALLALGLDGLGNGNQHFNRDARVLSDDRCVAPRVDRTGEDAAQRLAVEGDRVGTHQRCARTTGRGAVRGHFGGRLDGTELVLHGVRGLVVEVRDDGDATERDGYLHVLRGIRDVLAGVVQRHVAETDVERRRRRGDARTACTRARGLVRVERTGVVTVQTLPLGVASVHEVRVKGRTSHVQCAARDGLNGQSVAEDRTLTGGERRHHANSNHRNRCRQGNDRRAECFLHYFPPRKSSV